MAFMIHKRVMPPGSAVVFTVHLQVDKKPRSCATGGQSLTTNPTTTITITTNAASTTADLNNYPNAIMANQHGVTARVAFVDLDDTNEHKYYDEHKRKHLCQSHTW